MFLFSKGIRYFEALMKLKRSFNGKDGLCNPVHPSGCRLSPSGYWLNEPTKPIVSLLSKLSSSVLLCVVLSACIRCSSDTSNLLQSHAHHSSAATLFTSSVWTPGGNISYLTSASPPLAYTCLCMFGKL